MKISEIISLILLGAGLAALLILASGSTAADALLTFGLGAAILTTSAGLAQLAKWIEKRIKEK